MINASGIAKLFIFSDIAILEPDTNMATIGVINDVPQLGQPRPITARIVTNVLSPITISSVFCRCLIEYIIIAIARPCTIDRAMVSTIDNNPTDDFIEIIGS